MLRQEMEKRKRSRALEYFVPHPKQKLFHDSDARQRLVIGGNRCIGGETLIYDPVLGVERRVDEIESNHHVLALSGGEVIVSPAETPFTKGVDDIYRIILDDGSHFSAATSHLVLTPCGYVPISQLLRGVGLFLQESTSDTSPLIRDADDQRSRRTVQDSLYGCHLFCHSCGEQLRSILGNGQDVVPLPDDAQAHIFCAACEREGGLDSTRECSQTCQLVGLPSIQGDQHRPEAQSADTLSDVSCKPCRSASGLPPTAPRSKFEFSHQQSIHGSDSQDTYLAYLVDTSITSLRKVVIVQWLRKDVKWDFTVPVHHNYFAGGVFHHNSGKSECGIAEDLAHALGYRPWNGTKVEVTLPSKGIIYAPDFENNHKRTTIKKIEMLCPPEKIIKRVKGQQGIIRCYHIDCGFGISEIHLGTYKGFKQDPQSAESADWDWIHWDEPPPQELHSAAARGLIDRDGREWFTLTPLREPWIREKIKDQEGLPGKSIFVVEMDMDDNPHLTEKAKKIYLDQLSPDEKEARKSGKWLDLAGVIYKTWNRKVHVVKKSIIKPEWPRGMICDPALRRPFALAWFAQTPAGHKIFYDEWPNTMFHEIKSYKNIVKEYVQLILKKEKLHNMAEKELLEWRILDPNFGRTPNPSSGETLEDEFENEGMYFDTRVEDSLDLGHEAVTKCLEYDVDEPISVTNTPQIFVTENCHNIIFGMENYQWDEWKGYSDSKSWKEKPKDKFKDFPDLVRYAVMYDTFTGEIEVDNDILPEDMGNSGYGF